MVTKREKEVMPKINDLKRQIKDLEKKYEKLRASVGYEELHGWKPNPRIESQYGWVHAWLYPLYSFLNSNTSPDIRNKVMAITRAIISQLTIYGKYGIKIPYESKIINVEYKNKQIKYYEYNYDSCDICGEDRITHQCHIIPRSDGGVSNIENFVTLCPLHHHLFDHDRLYETEWELLRKVIDTKMPSAITYSREIRENNLKYFWLNTKRVYPIDNSLT